MFGEEMITERLESHSRLSVAEADPFHNSQAVSFGNLKAQDGLFPHEKTLVDSLLPGCYLTTTDCAEE